MCGDFRRRTEALLFTDIACLKVLIIALTISASFFDLGVILKLKENSLSCGPLKRSSKFGFTANPLSLPRILLEPRADCNVFALIRSFNKPVFPSDPIRVSISCFAIAPAAPEPLSRKDFNGPATVLVSKSRVSLCQSTEFLSDIPPLGIGKVIVANNFVFLEFVLRLTLLISFVKPNPFATYSIT